MRKIFVRLAIALLLLGGGAIVAAGAWYLGDPGSDPEGRFDKKKILASLSSETPVYFRDSTTLLGSFFEREHRRYVTFAEMPAHLVEAIVSAEDARFFDHPGVDPLGIARAMFANVRAGKVVAGGSTLTQQTAKNIFGRSGRNMGAKWQELRDALELERRFSKQEILEFYLNQFHVTGSGRGVGIAAEYFFDRPLDSLNVRELAFLAGSVKGPANYDPHGARNDSLRALVAKRAELRTRYVLRRMQECGYLDSLEEAKALAQPLRFERGEFRRGVDRVMQLVMARMDSPWMTEQLAAKGVGEWRDAGLRIVTTLDAPLQAQAFKVLQDSAGKLDSWLGWTGTEPGSPRVDGAVLAMRHGELLASVGGRDQLGFDRVWDAHRPFGSTWKPLLVALALELGWQEDDLLENEDNLITDGIEFYWPRPDHTTRAPEVTLRWMVVKSENIAAVQLGFDLLRPLTPEARREAAASVGLLSEADGEPEAFRKKLDSAGMVLDERAEAEMRYDRARTQVAQRLLLEGDQAEARALSLLPYGVGFAVEAAKLKGKEAPERRERMNRCFATLRSQLQRRDEERSTLSAVAETVGDLLGVASDTLPGGIRVTTLREIVREMGVPLTPEERLLPENLLQWPRYRAAVSQRLFAQFCRRLGMESKIRPVLSQALGTNEVSLGELVRAYQTLLTGSRWQGNDTAFSEVLIRQVIGPDGKVLVRDSARATERIVTLETSERMALILESVVRSGTGTRADWGSAVSDSLGRSTRFPVAGKTGTTNQSLTLAFAGGIAGKASVPGAGLSYAEGYALGSWVGNDVNRPLVGKRGGLGGASGALPIWVGTMQALLKQERLAQGVDFLDMGVTLDGRARASFSQPLVQRAVDPLSGVASEVSAADSLAKDPAAPPSATPTGALWIDQWAGEGE